ncbi:MAG: DNA-processing protein DprA [Candidatus Brocadiaceae bacterium]|nr:DNA-processing protein DprA [Candidatus Brocadiaceae bacterium]
MTEFEAILRLHMTKGLGIRTYQTLLERFGTPEAILHASKTKLEALSGIGPKLAYAITEESKNIDIEGEIKLAGKNNVQIIPYTSDRYPKHLNAIYDPPLILYVKGAIRETDLVALAIVGSRRCSYYGLSQAERFSRLLVQKGFCIVSGMARGIDTAAHQGAISSKGRTIAVLGSGLGTIYPRENIELSEQIALHGALVSEFPMNTPPDFRNFPPRNRLISGLSLGVVVIESSLKSGSLITARWALEQGKEVFAMPGNIDSLYSRGTHKLIKEGAKLVEDVADIIQELGPMAEILDDGDIPVENDPRNLSLNSHEKKIFSLLSCSPKYIDEIIQDACLPTSVVSSTLMILEIKKMAKQLSGKRFVKA